MTENSNNKTFLPGDFIFREGEFGKVAYVIEEGEIELVKFTGDEYITLAEITKGALFGEMAIIDGSPRSGSARAKTSCVLREVTEEQLKQTVQEFLDSVDSSETVPDFVNRPMRTYQQ